MERLYSSREVLEADRRAEEEYLFPPLCLMEQAAMSAAAQVYDMSKDGDHVTIVAGSGNNGADGLALARLLHTAGRRRVSIFHVPGRMSAGNEAQRRCCEALGIGTTDSLDGASLIVDAYLGAGLRGALRKEAEEVIHLMAAAKAPILCLDVPSGISDEAYNPSIQAQATIVFGPLKRSIYARGNLAGCGRIVRAPLSYPKQLFRDDPPVCLLDEDDYRRLSLPGDAYKVSRGRVAIIGGSPDYRGAVRLAARAAFHAGAGMVTVFTDPSLVDLVSLDCPASTMVRPFSDLASAGSFDSILVGPGLGQGVEARRIVGRVCGMKVPRLVVDADAIRFFEGAQADEVVLTPHVGEYRIFAGGGDASSPNDFYAGLMATAGRLGATIVYKAESVYIATQMSVDIVIGLKPSLGVAGSGDVLAGIIAALGKGEPPSNGVLLHQASGAALANQKGFYSADELIDEVGRRR